MTKITKIQQTLASGLLLAALSLSVIALPAGLHAGETNHVAHEGDKFTSPAEAWTAVQGALTEIESLVMAKNLQPVHEASEKLNGGLDYIKNHPAEGADKARLEGAVKNALAASDKLHEAADAGDQAKSESSLKTLKATLALVEKQIGTK